MTEALRDNAGKAELSQLMHFLPALQELAAHCTAGREKYPDTDGVPNWTLGGKPDAEYLDAAMRHLAAIVRGEDYDPELGTTHAAAVIWNLSAYVTCNHADRPVRAERSTTDLTMRARYEGEEGQFNDPSSTTWYADGGRKVELTSAQWAEAAKVGVLVYQ